MSSPPYIDTRELDALLANQSPDVQDAVRRRLSDIRPCVAYNSIRVGTTPLRGTAINRLLRRPSPPLAGDPTASKFGGLPYAEGLRDLGGGRFIGQLNFAEITSALMAEGFSLPDGMPTSGLLAIDLEEGTSRRGRVRWYAEPESYKAVTPTRIKWAAKYESRPQFRGGWSLRGLEWFDHLDYDSTGLLWEWMNDLDVKGIDETRHPEPHKVFGHPDEALNDHYGFDPYPGRSSNIREYALIWRVTYDNPAGMAWGTNWVYVIIHRDDLAAGAFERAVITGANA